MTFLCFGFVFFFQAEDGIRDSSVTGVQTCALPISRRSTSSVLIAFDASLRALEGARLTRDFANQIADVAQLAEQPPRKWQVPSSNLGVGSRSRPRNGRLAPKMRNSSAGWARLAPDVRNRPRRRSGTLTSVGKVSIAGLVLHMAAHDSMHTAQIARRLSGRPR